VKRVLITGARGFIGRHAPAELLLRGYEVHAVTSQVPARSTEGIEWHHADLTDPRAVRSLLGAVEPTHLLHFAWYVEHGVFWTSPQNERWREASLALLGAFEGQRAVFVGSCAEYDWDPGGVLSESDTPIAPRTPYGIAKDALRAEAEARCAARDVSFAWGRVFFVHGPDEHPNRLVASVTRSLLRGEPAPCSDGRQVRDFMHTSDVARGFVALLDSEVRGPVNVASGEGVPVAQVVGWIGAAVGRPELIELGALPNGPDEPPVLVADVARLRNEVGYEPIFTPRRAVEETVRWWSRSVAVAVD
jgi:nucleoside-diphosphate-sugar epimerase